MQPPVKNILINGVRRVVFGFTYTFLQTTLFRKRSSYPTEKEKHPVAVCVHSLKLGERKFVWKNCLWQRCVDGALQGDVKVASLTWLISVACSSSASRVSDIITETSAKQNKTRLYWGQWGVSRDTTVGFSRWQSPTRIAWQEMFVVFGAGLAIYTHNRDYGL